MTTARTLTVKQLIPETYWGKNMAGHPQAAKCPNCGDDMLKIGVIRLVYSMEVCKCDRASYPHLYEQLWHRQCFIDRDGKLPEGDIG